MIDPWEKYLYKTVVNWTSHPWNMLDGVVNVLKSSLDGLRAALWITKPYCYCAQSVNQNYIVWLGVSKSILLWTTPSDVIITCCRAKFHGKFLLLGLYVVTTWHKFICPEHPWRSSVPHCPSCWQRFSEQDNALTPQKQLRSCQTFYLVVILLSFLSWIYPLHKWS